MKTILLCMMLMLSGMLTAQTVDNPPFKARSGSIGNITRIERTPDGTRVYIHAIFRPHWWIKEEGDSYLEDAATGKKYQFKSAEGIELNKESVYARFGRDGLCARFRSSAGRDAGHPSPQSQRYGRKYV